MRAVLNKPISVNVRRLGTLSPVPPPLWGRGREGGKLQTPALAIPPSPTLPHKGREGSVCSWHAPEFNYEQ